MTFGVLHHIYHYLLCSALYTIPVYLQLIAMCFFILKRQRRRDQDLII